jgi:hypothetical protein
MFISPDHTILLFGPFMGDRNVSLLTELEKI